LVEASTLLALGLMMISLWLGRIVARIVAHRGASWRIVAHRGASWRIVAHRDAS
jgi:hypothetical protein